MSLHNPLLGCFYITRQKRNSSDLTLQTPSGSFLLHERCLLPFLHSQSRCKTKTRVIIIIICVQKYTTTALMPLSEWITALLRRTAATPALISHLHLCSCHLLLIRLSLFSLSFVFPCFVFLPPPPSYFSLALSGERYAVAPKSRGCGSMGIFQHRDNRNAALTGAIELIRRARL